MAKKTHTTTTTVKLLKSCVRGGADSIVELENSVANHLILYGYAEISSGQSGQKNTDSEKD